MILKKLKYFLLIFSTLNCFTLMINPFGDAQCAGRIVDDSFERGLTLQFAEELQKKISQILPIRVVLSRFAGETLENLQVANFSNRLQVDFFISIHFYKSNFFPKLHIYYYSKNNFEKQLATENLFSCPLFLCPIEEVYRFNINNTKKIAELFFNNLNNTQSTKKWLTQKPLGIPFLPLKGIVAPSIALEIGLNKSDDWHKIIDYITEAFVLTFKN